MMDALAENLAGSEDFESARAESTVVRATILVSARMSGTETTSHPHLNRTVGVPNLPTSVDDRPRSGGAHLLLST